MVRKKSDKETQSISFEIEVLNALKEFCRKEKMNMSTLVNSITKKVVMTEYEYYRQITKYHAAEMNKFKTLMETSPDKPEVQS